jgi:hypothetical protein
LIHLHKIEKHGDISENFACPTSSEKSLTMNVPVVYLAWYVMVSRLTKSITKKGGRGGALPCSSNPNNPGHRQVRW